MLALKAFLALAMITAPIVKPVGKRRNQMYLTTLALMPMSFLGELLSLT